MRAPRTVGAPKKKPAPRAPDEAATGRASAHVLDVPFAMRAVATASGARWNADHGVFVYSGDTLPAGLVPFTPVAYSWERHVERELRGEAPTEVSKAAEAPDGSRGSITLRWRC